jgi:hypothetical protein
LVNIGLETCHQAIHARDHLIANHAPGATRLKQDETTRT